MRNMWWFRIFDFDFCWFAISEDVSSYEVFNEAKGNWTTRME